MHWLSACALAERLRTISQVLRHEARNFITSVCVQPLYKLRSHPSGVHTTSSRRERLAGTSGVKHVLLAHRLLDMARGGWEQFRNRHPAAKLNCQGHATGDNAVVPDC
jgi:hypothetical protein